MRHSLWRVYSWLKIAFCSFDSLFNYILLSVFKVEYNAYPKIRGRLFIRSSGVIKLGAGVTLNSCYSANPIGGAVMSSFKVFKGGSLQIGNRVGISNSAICCASLVVLEDDVLIGGNCAIYDTDFHSTKYNERIKNELDQDVRSSPVLIKRGAFIGASCIILKGVTVGENSIVGAGSVVSRSIPSNQIWGGNPARFLRNLRSDETPSFSHPQE